MGRSFGTVWSVQNRSSLSLLFDAFGITGMYKTHLILFSKVCCFYQCKKIKFDKCLQISGLLSYIIFGVLVGNWGVWLD
jgi:hypothetical protein